MTIASPAIRRGSTRVSAEHVPSRRSAAAAQRWRPSYPDLRIYSTSVHMDSGTRLPVRIPTIPVQSLRIRPAGRYVRRPTGRSEKTDRQVGGRARRMHSRPAENLLIESQEEVRSDLRSRKFAQIRSIIQAGSGMVQMAIRNRLSKNSHGR
jgi:hypothetical protein